MDAAADPGDPAGFAPAPLELGATPDAALLEMLSAHWRQLAVQQARVWAVMAEVANRPPLMPLPGQRQWTPDQVFESAVDEIRAELRLTRRAARIELEHAVEVAAVPRVAAALAAGQLDRRRAVVLAEGCCDLTPEQVSTLLDEVLPSAADVTATTLADRVRRVAVALDPEWAERRYREAIRGRRVVGYLNADGSATVAGQNLPADEAAAACGRVDALAGAAKRAGAGAPIDHLRAELFLGLLDGRFHTASEADIVAALLRDYPPRPGPAEPGAESAAPRADSAAPRAESAAQSSPAATRPRGVELRVGLGTLLGVDDQPGHIAGWGMTTAGLARSIAARQQRAEWRYAIHDSAGQLVFDGITRRRPRGQASLEQAEGGIVELLVPVSMLADAELATRSPEWAELLADLAQQFAAGRRPHQDPDARFAGRPLRRHSQTRYQRCIFPGCRRPATGCDQDHLREHSRRGPTSAQNLAPACRHDHMNRTSRGWRVARHGERGFVWTSPLGRKHLADVPPVAPPLRRRSPGLPMVVAGTAPLMPWTRATGRRHSCRSPDAADRLPRRRCLPNALPPRYSPTRTHRPSDARTLLNRSHPPNRVAPAMPGGRNGAAARAGPLDCPAAGTGQPRGRDRWTARRPEQRSGAACLRYWTVAE
jgi:hypothetical protein